MPWILSSVIATLTGPALLSFIYFYLFYKDKKDYLGIWALSWSIYLLRYVFILWIIIDHETPLLLISTQAASLVSGVILLWGTYRFIGWRFPKIFVYLLCLGLFWIIFSNSIKLSFHVISLPTFSFLAFVYIWTGVSFIRSNVSDGHEKNIAGWAFVIWGIHTVGFPFLQSVIWLAPWGYLFGTLIELLVAIGILLVYYQKIQNDLKKERYYLKKSQEELLKNEERYRALFDNIPINTIVVDKEGKITEYKFPEDPGKIIEPKIGDVMYVDYAEYPYLDMYKILMDSIKTGNQKEYLDMKYDDKYLQIRISPYQDGAIITAVDTTPVRKLESELQQAQKMEGIGTLAGGIAHDFNNILSPIMLHAEMAMDDLEQDDPLQLDMKEIYRAAKRARDLVKQILTFARKGKEDRIVLRSSLIIKETIKFLRSTIPTTIDIQYYDKAEKDTIFSDPAHINQIIMNLCTNAAYAMSEKGGLLEVTIENDDISTEKTDKSVNLNPGRYLKISVKDNGTGISPDIIDKIFEPYYTTKQTGQGTGLGLSIIHGIIKSYGGDIYVESKTGHGTTFYVYLPLTDEEVSSTDDQKKEIPAGTERILFVDDEKASIDANRKMLERLGYKVTARTSSVEALEAFRNKPASFDLVITDMTMPNMTGVDLAKELMTVKPGIPVILCTGFSEKIDGKKAKEIGINAFIFKPVVMSDMAKTIREVLDRKQL